MERLNPRARRDVYGSRINRAHSPFFASVVPWLTIMLGSLVTALPVVSAIPLMPPLALLLLLAWRFIRPGVVPVWAGFPLGLWDDLFSGQPFGSAILLYSLILLGIEALEARFPWRSFLQDWLLASVLSAAYLFLSLILSGARIDAVTITYLWPQALLSILSYPIIARMVAIFDRIRLVRFRVED
ncbi:rod shape-determining protein MreD [Erythrobacter sp. LQ02-29]|uniref:rod shape-determining protein MreD n=1 Tax=Erythrobacter sp. LQ02-29 TaxID=2920384 RepID=UPI001F4D6F7F|nr:rod shape-determining protein MreD [Erythrobacter sp. LQ02-29]MCP9223171.1 rod shape-determining protein MreD [Erythrobacter sp. LQ02-29]